MKVLFPDFHGTIPYAFAKSFNNIGITMVMCDNTFPISYGKKWTKAEVSKLGINVECISWAEFLENPTDIVMINCYEQQQDILSKVMPNVNWKPKMVYYSGNDDMYKYYVRNHVKNILAVDKSTYDFYSIQQDVNCIRYYPRVDYDNFVFSGFSDNKVINCYTSFLQKFFPESYEITKNMVETDGIEFNYYGEPDNYILHNKMVSEIRRSFATNCIKRIEGYGYNIIESMAMGRPVIHYKPFTINRTFTNWLNNETGIIFESKEDFKMQIEQYMLDEDFRHNKQELCAKVIRDRINNEEQDEKLRIFFENLK